MDRIFLEIECSTATRVSKYDCLVSGFECILPFTIVTEFHFSVRSAVIVYDHLGPFSELFSYLN